MRRIQTRRHARFVFAVAPVVLAGTAILQGCGSDDGVTTSVGMSVGVGYGGYYGPGWYGGYYEPYPPVVVVPPDERPDRPNGPDKPTTLPSTRPGGPACRSSAPCGRGPPRSARS